MTSRTKRTRQLVRVATLFTVLAGWFGAPRLFRQWVEPTALAAPMIFVVNTAADADDGLCSTAASGCTLREAINAANANSGPDTINFNIPGAGLKTINLTSKLPALASPVTIDGYTQGVATPNTLANGDNALLLIELKGTDVDNAEALSLFAGDSTVRGLIIDGFSLGMSIGPGSSNTVEGCFIGTNPQGDGPGAYNGFGGSNGRGVSIFSANNTLGGTTPAARNIISGNLVGVQITNGAATGNKVQNNYIGTDTSGSKPIGNNQAVLITNASGNTIGGTVLSAGNLIAFNYGHGINLDQSSTGNAFLGNSIHSNTRLGINLGGEGVTANDTGDADTGANNLQNFPVLTSANSIGANTTIQGTLNSTPSTPFRIEIFSSPSCDESGNGEGRKLMDSGTLVTNAAGNLGFASVVPTASLAGPYITATATDPSNNTSEFSQCVTALGSSFTVNSTADTDDGFCTPAAGGCTLREAINAANSNADANTIKFDIPGSGVRTIAPLAQLPIIVEPVIIDGYTQTGATPNTLAEGDNATLLIELNGASAGNAMGLRFLTGSSVVRGLIINRFASQSIALFSSSDNVIAGNFIGIDQTGTSDLGNGTGILLTNSSNLNRIGGIVPADRNVISGNNQAGIQIESSDANVVWGNYIGTDASGAAAIGNATGIKLNSHFYNRIGGTMPQARNVISGNSIGLLLDGSSASNNRVQGNYIGTDASGTKGLGNSGPGISIGSLEITSGNLIGVDVFGGDNDQGSNVIAFNGGDGIFAAQGVGNAIFGNNIHSNGGLGIDLAPDGVTANDANDSDSGVNNLQNFPIPSAATVTNNQITVSYSLNSKPNATFVVSLFSSATCDPSGNGEGEHATGFVESVTTNSAGMVTSTAGPFSANLGGRFITMTATDSAGNTSEFSPCLQAPFVSTFQFGTPSMTTVEDCDEVVFTVSRIGDTSTAASVDYATQSGTASDRTDFTATRGTLHFAPGETAMTISVLISEDSFPEGTETATITLSNPSGAGIGNPSTASLQILDDPPEPSVNANDVAEQFVCQHYHDFLNRQHDVAGLNFWTNEIESCGANLQCREARRVNVSAAFFLSIEFQETGFFEIRVQRVAFARKSDNAASRITYNEFIRDARTLGDGVIVLQPGYEQKLEQNKQTYAEQIVAGAAFISKYPLALTADQYVDALFTSAGVVPTSTERQDGIIAFGAGGTAGRVAALRKAADSASLRSAEFRSAFVLMQYFGYLRRNPTDAPDGNDNGYQFWLAKLNTFNGDFVKAEMVRAFIISTEYRSRFGQP